MAVTYHRNYFFPLFIALWKCYLDELISSFRNECGTYANKPSNTGTSGMLRWKGHFLNNSYWSICEYWLLPCLWSVLKWWLPCQPSYSSTVQEVMRLIGYLCRAAPWLMVWLWHYKLMSWKYIYMPKLLSTIAPQYCTVELPSFLLWTWSWLEAVAAATVLHGKTVTYLL